jgi:CheY-like chemotaxis protein
LVRKRPQFAATTNVLDGNFAQALESHAGGGGGLVLNGRRVLLVEDDPLVVETIRDMVEEAGGELAASPATMAEARRLLRADAAFDVALLDVNLADGEVTPLLEALQTRRVPVVVFSGGELPANLRKRHPTLRVLRKPVIKARLVAELRTASPRATA